MKFQQFNKDETMTIIQAIENLEMNSDIDEMLYIQSFQTLIDAGIVWELQGWYGRMASLLIKQNYCTL
jgi:hypothetical protein